MCLLCNALLPCLLEGDEIPYQQKDLANLNKLLTVHTAVAITQIKIQFGFVNGLTVCQVQRALLT